MLFDPRIGASRCVILLSRCFCLSDYATLADGVIPVKTKLNFNSQQAPILGLNHEEHEAPFGLHEEG